MGYLIDTSVFIDHFRGAQPQVSQWIARKAREGHPVTCSIVVAELVLGASNVQTVERILATLRHWKVLGVEYDDGLLAGKLIRQHRQRGVTVHLADALIGACALRRNLTVATSNVRDFSFVATFDPRRSLLAKEDPD